MNGFAYILKKEKLKIFSDDSNSLKDLVFTDTDSYPGYYSEIPGKSSSSKPRFAFLVVRKSDICQEDMFLRTSIEIKEKLKYNFVANYSTITFLNKHYSSIRIVIEDFSKIPLLIEEYNQKGIFFEKHKKVQPFESMIKIKKHIELKEITDGIFSGKKANHFYLKVPKYIDWMDFENLIISTKATNEFKHFDAAIASHFGKEGEINEFFRIYTELFDTSDFKKLKEMFLRKLDRL